MEKLEWRYRLPLFSAFIWGNIAKGFLITIVVLLAFLFVISGFYLDVDISQQTPDIYFAGGFVALIIFLTLLVFVILFWRGFEMDYAVDGKGLYQTVKGTSSKVHNWAIILGTLGRSPATIGAGLTAKGGEERFISWREASTIRVDKKKKYIHVSRNFLGIYPIDMFCTDKNFSKVTAAIKKHALKKTRLSIED